MGVMNTYIHRQIVTLLEFNEVDDDVVLDIEDFLDELYNLAYGEGYDDGYNNGYDDGYDDGYYDGSNA